MDTFRRTVPIGVDHGTVGVLDGDDMYEVTTFRRDVETFGRHAVVEFAEQIEEDLSRRDFTINALAWHPLRGELLDPFGGRDDLAAGRLRMVGDPVERLAEDRLRVLRAFRFAGLLDLEIEDAAWAALREAVPHLTELSAERVREELLKVLSQTRPASRSLELYRRSGALAQLFPELAALEGERPAGEGPDLWTVTLHAVDALPPSRPVLRLAALLHAVGMPPARTRDLRGGWRYTGHEVLGSRKTEDVMHRMKSSNADTERVTALVRHQPELFPPDSPDAVVRRWLRHVGPERVRDLFRLRFALWRAERATSAESAGGVEARPEDLLERWSMVRRVLRDRPALRTGDLAIDGGDLKALGLQPGPQFGTILSELLERVTDDPSLNHRDRLLALVREGWLDE